MKIIGRAVRDGEGTPDWQNYRPSGEILVSMTHDEMEMWKALTDKDLVLSKESVEAYRTFRWATKDAAVALGMLKAGDAS